MFHEDIMYISYRKYVRKYFVCIAKDFILTNLKAIFWIFKIFLHLQIPHIQIIVSRPFVLS